VDGSQSIGQTRFVPVQLCGKAATSQPVSNPGPGATQVDPVLPLPGCWREAIFFSCAATPPGPCIAPPGPCSATAVPCSATDTLPASGRILPTRWTASGSGELFLRAARRPANAAAGATAGATTSSSEEEQVWRTGRGGECWRVLV
jgi:hypothetical protein